MASEMVLQIVEVLKICKDDIWTDLESNYEVTEKIAEEKLKFAIKQARKKFAVKDDSTIYDKCTRQIHLTAAEFYELGKRYVSGQDNNLEEQVVAHLKPTKDSEGEIRKLMRASRDN